MIGWVNCKVGMPNSEIPCILLRRDISSFSVYPKFAQWDDNGWIDIDGEEVTDVIAWKASPTHNVLEALSKLSGCLKKDTCEKQDCCYFTEQKAIEALLEYIEM